ncbi:hypothetical protein H206_00919 [Candidatus Electrothrix aarhusensis]|uniref:Uncharacterized protein n=1 Tax=Candidatus Electrothrix aarhusensis TaxID=1859131 RepID=A0A3S3U9U2_9BACT|nr:hypothetical protein H206_00919 [Candidatus Electrothrix aarhusensis]
MKAIFLGALFLIAGGRVILHPKYYSYQYAMTIDFTKVKYPLGIACISIGLILFWSFYKDKKK